MAVIFSAGNDVRASPGLKTDGCTSTRTKICATIVCFADARRRYSQPSRESRSHLKIRLAFKSCCSACRYGRTGRQRLRNNPLPCFEAPRASLDAILRLIHLGIRLFDNGHLIHSISTPGRRPSHHAYRLSREMEVGKVCVILSVQSIDRSNIFVD